MCADYRTFQANIPTQDCFYVYGMFSHVQIPIPIFWRLLNKPIGSKFGRRIALHPLQGFMKIKIGSRVPYNNFRSQLLDRNRSLCIVVYLFIFGIVTSYESSIHNFSFSPEMRSLRYLNVERTYP